MHYNLVGEYASVLLGALLVIAMVYTKPKKTFVYKYLFIGTFWAIVSVISQIIVVYIANNADRLYNKEAFDLLIILSLMIFNGVLYYIFSYVNMLSLVRRGQRKEFFMMYALLTIIYVFAIVVRFMTTGFYKVTENGIDIAIYIRFHCIAGIVCAIICFYASLANRAHISRVIWDTVCLVVPIAILIQLIQIVCIYTNRSVFSGLTFVPMFMLAFLLFHNMPYDEVSGCQSANALDEFLKKNVGKKKFYMMYSEFRLPSVDNFISESEDVYYIGIKACRSIESISKKIIMYRLEPQKFINIINCPDEKQALVYADQIRGVMDSVKAELKIPFNYMMITSEVIPELDTPMKIRQMMEFVAKRFVDQNNSYYYVIKPSDLDNFAEIYDLTVALKDIRDKCDLDDERVLVYAQPIYSVDTGSFRVAEALMRLKLGDHQVSPDRFIPIAEQSGCVHILTCIILNKVCKAIENMDDYEFDAISINVSSRELSHETMYQDLLDIIDRYDIDVSKIRMEITETAMFENYDLANRNMEILNKEGIQLYLDDFGTGYSSLERVINCPVKTIKFDKTLLYKSLDDDRMDDIMSYMIEVLKKNGFVTLVEGVEDESQNQYSMNRGFDYIQGYHYAKPGPIEDLVNYFKRKEE